MFKRIRTLREDRNWTQKQISGMLNVTQTTYSRYELGYTEIPLTVLLQLALIHKTSVDYLLDLTDERKPYSKAWHAEYKHN